MDHKSVGAEYDRETLVTGPEPTARPYTMIGIGAAVVVALAFMGGMAFRTIQPSSGVSGGDNRALLEVQSELSQIQDRMDKMEKEQTKLAAMRAVAPAPAPAPAPQPVQERPAPQVTYRYVVSPAPAQTEAQRAEQEQLKQGLASVQSQSAANQQAWQASSDRMAAIAGQVGEQQGQILNNQKQLDQLLADSSHEAVSFELRRGPQSQVGPLSLELKAANAKRGKYTVCVYIQKACVELRDRSPLEVVQFAITGEQSPYELIATKIDRDQISGYLEVPRQKTER